MSKATFKSNKGKSRSRYRLCVPPCPRYITSGDTHSLCVVCLGVKHAGSRLSREPAVSVVWGAISSVETTAKCISLGPADCRERLSYSVRRSAAAFQRSISHIGESRAGSGIRTRSDHSLEEGSHRGGPSSRQRVRVLQAVFHCSKEGWGGYVQF